LFDREGATDPESGRLVVAKISAHRWSAHCAAWESSIRSPEGVTFHACSDKPRPAEEEGSKGGALEQIAINWGMDWPVSTPRET
jgi:hypothetical protein